MFNPVLPNRIDDKTIRGYLLQRGQTKLRRMAGYLPDKSIDEIATLQPLAPNMTEWGDAVMKKFFDSRVSNYNPRIPYLVLTWQMLGDGRIIDLSLQSPPPNGVLNSSIYNTNAYMVDTIKIQTAQHYLIIDYNRIEQTIAEQERDMLIALQYLESDLTQPYWENRIK